MCHLAVCDDTTCLKLPFDALATLTDSLVEFWIEEICNLGFTPPDSIKHNPMLPMSRDVMNRVPVR